MITLFLQKSLVLNLSCSGEQEEKERKEQDEQRKKQDDDAKKKKALTKTTQSLGGLQQKVCVFLTNTQGHSRLV